MKAKKWIVLLMIFAMLCTLLAGCKAKPAEESAATDSVVEDTTPDQSGQGNKPSAMPEESEKAPEQKPEQKPEQTPEQKPEQTPEQTPEQPEPEDSFEGYVDPYENTPISKTPAKTENGITYFKENTIKVVSYNIRCADDPNGNSIEERAPRLESVLQKYDPDLIGFQEFVPGWEMPLDFALSDNYDYVLQYRAPSSSEGTPIFWKKSKFKLLDSGHFWLSETPESASKGWGADYYRICSWVKLEIRQTGKVIYFFNTHFDFKDDPQVNSAKLLIKKASEICKGAPMIVSADYNMTWKSKGYAEMTSFFTDVNIKRDETKTYHGYKENASSLIDFIFVTGNTVLPTAYNVMNERPNGKFVSDHYGVYTELIIL